MAAGVLVLGYGNPGRRDDGLGAALAERLAALRLPEVTVEAGYQLAVEDAAEAARHECVVFADAALRGRAPFKLRRVRPGGTAGFSSHCLGPEAVLALARDLFGAAPRAYLLAIRGYVFGAFGESLSPRARRNLEAAFEFLRTWLADGGFRRSLPVRRRRQAGARPAARLGKERASP
jgi:hydrogenase maturation protease